MLEAVLKGLRLGRLRAAKAAGTAALAGGAVSADAPTLSYLALCAADPVAWMAADTVLLFPFLRNILRQDYRYFYRSEV